MRRALAIFVSLILASSFFGCTYSGQEKTPRTQQDEQSPDVADEEAAVRDLVEEFGRRLQMVPLLAPPDEVRERMQQQYGELVAHDLLTRWQADPERAPGRLTSSPWPDRIEIETMERTSNGSYEVKGHVVEITSVEQRGGDYAARYPVTVTVTKVGDRWLITGFEQRGSSSREVPRRPSARGSAFSPKRLLGHVPPEQAGARKVTTRVIACTTTRSSHKG